jgi:hypothetical protein
VVEVLVVAGAFRASKLPQVPVWSIAILNEDDPSV